MLKFLALTAALLFPSAAFAQSPPPTRPQPIQVMVVGTFHFDNPGQDLNNVAVDPVTTPAKQAELAAVAEGLRRFHPTAIALEREATDTATLLDQMTRRSRPPRWRPIPMSESRSAIGSPILKRSIAFMRSTSSRARASATISRSARSGPGSRPITARRTFRR